MAALPGDQIINIEGSSTKASSSTCSRETTLPNVDVSNSQSHISTEGCENKNRTLEMSAGEREPLVHHNDIMPQKYRDGKAKACPLLSILMFWCSSCMLRHGKTCTWCGVLIALLSFAICVLLLGWYSRPIKTSLQNPNTFHIAPLSVIEVNLNKYNINTILSQGVKVTVNTIGQSYKYQGVIEFTAHNEPVHYVNKALKLPKNLLLKTGTKLVRHWDSIPTGKISCATNSSTVKVVWGWGNLRKKPNIRCNNYNHENSFTCNANGIHVDDIYKKRNRNDEHQVTMLFCGENNYIEVNIDIEEKLPEPKTACQSLYINNYAGSIQNTVVVSFQRIFNGLKAGKQPQVYLYINTEGLHNFLNDYDSIEIQLEPIRNTKIWKLEAIGEAAFFLIFITTGLSIYTFYKLRQSNITYVTIGWIYHKED